MEMNILWYNFMVSVKFQSSVCSNKLNSQIIDYGRRVSVAYSVKYKGEHPSHWNRFRHSMMHAEGKYRVSAVNSCALRENLIGATPHLPTESASGDSRLGAPYSIQSSHASVPLLNIVFGHDAYNFAKTSGYCIEVCEIRFFNLIRKLCSNPPYSRMVLVDRYGIFLASL